MLRDFSKDEFDIIIQAGQSNSEGSGFGEATTPYIVNNDIWYLVNDFTMRVAHEVVLGNDIVGNFSLSFCTKYIEEGKLASGRKLLVIRAAVGGTGFLDHRWGMTDDLYLRMMEMIKTALELNPNNKLIAILWHQGETDAFLNATKQEHIHNLSTLAHSVRSIFECETLPFIAGDFVSQWKGDNVEISEPIVSAMKEACVNIGHAVFVETQELQSNDQKIHNQDMIHFCRDALNQLGIKYYNAFCNISKA